MEDNEELRINVASIKRLDPYARDIVESATHVALYTFEHNAWEKTSIEGALFLYSRNGKPFHSMVIMNRHNLNTLIEPVNEGLDLQVQAPYILYRNSRQKIYGIWFYEMDECVKIANLINNLTKDVSKSAPNGHKPLNQASTVMSSAGGSVDIFSMLSKAQDDYNSNKGLAGAAAGAGGGAASGGRPDPQPRAPDLTSQSVMDFFAKASGGQPQAQNFRVPHPPAEGPLMFHRLMSNPVHSVEHIEKQQRSVTPVSTSKTNPDNNPKGGNPGFKLKTNPGDGKRKTSQPNKPDPPKNHIQLSSRSLSYAAPSNKDEPKAVSNGQNLHLENDLSYMHVTSPKSVSPLASFLNQSKVCNEESGLRSMKETPQKPALMPPTMFTSSARKLVVERPVLEPPLTPIKPPTEELRPEPLTRNQLLQAFNYLIKNDADFVNKLHEAYVKSFSELVS